MKAYEGMFLLEPTMKKEDMDALLQEIEADITKNQGKIAEVQRVGRRRLEHPIRKQPEAYFVLINFNADSQAVKKLTSKFNLKETILRFFFVNRDEGFVKFKSFDENAPHYDGFGYGGYPSGASEGAAR